MNLVHEVFLNNNGQYQVNILDTDTNSILYTTRSYTDTEQALKEANVQVKYKVDQTSNDSTYKHVLPSEFIENDNGYCSG